MSESSGGEWTTVVDPTSGNPYYYNTLTKETSWTLPTEPNRLASAPLATDPTDPADTYDKTDITSSAFGAAAVATGGLDDGDDLGMDMDMAAFMSGFGEAAEQQEDDAMDMDGLVAGFGAAAEAEPAEPAKDGLEKEHEALYGGVEGGSNVINGGATIADTTITAATSGPNEWKVHKDPSTGREFYSNATTGTPYKYLIKCSFYLSTARVIVSAFVTVIITKAALSWLFHLFHIYSFVVYLHICK